MLALLVNGTGQGRTVSNCAYVARGKADETPSLTPGEDDMTFVLVLKDDLSGYVYLYPTQ